MPLAEGTVDLVARDNVTGVLSTMDGVMSKTEQRMQSIARTAQMMLLAAGGIAGLALRESAAAGEIASQFTTVFKEQASAADLWADSFSAAVGRNKTDIMAYMAGLQDTFVPLGFARDEGRELSQVMTQLGVDLGSFKDMDAGEAIERLTGALIGNHENVRKFGVIITEATLNEQLMKMGIEGGTKAASEQQKVMARLQMILEGTTDAQGDAARTSDSAANQFRALYGEVRALAQSLGDALMPAAMKFVEVVKPIIVGTAEWIKNNSGLALAIAGVTTAFVGAIAILPKVIAGINAVRAVYALLTTSQIIQQALSGPKGWAVLAAGAAIAAATVAGVAVAYQGMNQEAAAAAQSAQEQADAVDKGADSADKLGSIMAKYGGGGGAAAGISKMTEDFMDAQQKLQDEIDTFGMSADEIERYNWSKKGISDTNLTFIKQLQDELATLNELKKAKEDQAEAEKQMQERGKQLTEQHATDLQKYMARIRDAKKLLDAAAINQTTFQRELLVATSDLAGSMKTEVKVRGLDEFTRDYAFRDKGEDPMVERLKDMINQGRDGNGLLKGMLDELAKIRSKMGDGKVRLG